MTPELYWANKLFKSEALTELVRLSLIQDYTIAGDWDTRDALRKVIRDYSSPQQYEAFMEVCDEQHES